MKEAVPESVLLHLKYWKKSVWANTAWVEPKQTAPELFDLDAHCMPASFLSACSKSL